jgi:uncharacterized protein YnzC (UPF0291/DUF896 family)
MIDKRTLALLDAALDAVSKDLAPRVEELAGKSTEGSLTHEEYEEYAQIVRMNDMLSEIKLEAEDFRSVRIAS